MISTPQRELFIRLMHIEHQKWYEAMISALFKSKNEMRRVLSLKTVYNSRSEYSMLMNLPFGQLKVFWSYLDDSSRSMLLKSAKDSTKQGTDAWHRIRDDVNAYPVTGPLGSQGPTLPIDIKDLEDKLLGQDDKLRELWKKRNIYEWAQKQGKVLKPFKPTNRAVSTMGRLRMPGDKCPSCVAAQTYPFARLKQLRIELRTHFDLLTSVLQVYAPSAFQPHQNLYYPTKREGLWTDSRNSPEEHRRFMVRFSTRDIVLYLLIDKNRCKTSLLSMNFICSPGDRQVQTQFDEVTWTLPRDTSLPSW